MTVIYIMLLSLYIILLSLESFVSDIPTGDGKIANLFVTVFCVPDY